MKLNYSYSALPFYESIEKQNHRKPYVDNVYPLLCASDRLLPFFILAKNAQHGTLSVKMYNLLGEVENDLTTAFTEVGFEKRTIEGIPTIVYPASYSLGAEIRDGMHYLRVSDGMGTWYSEVFCVRSIEDCVCVEWRSAEAMKHSHGVIPYPAYQGRLYFDTEVGKPEFEFTEEGESRDGLFFATKRLSTKKYKFNAPVPEYLCDVARTIVLADKVKITHNGGEYECDTFLPSFDWEEKGDIASMNVEFTTDNILKTIGTTYVDGDGDYNNDFNNDYNGELE